MNQYQIKQYRNLKRCKHKSSFENVSDNTKKYRVQQGVWLGERGSVWFGVNDTQKLILGLYILDGLKLILLENSRGSLDNYLLKEIDSTNEYGIIVRLVGDEQWIKGFKFKLRVENGKVIIVYNGEINPSTSNS